MCCDHKHENIRLSKCLLSCDSKLYTIHTFHKTLRIKFLRLSKTSKSSEIEALKIFRLYGMFTTVDDKITSDSGYLQCLDSGMDWTVDWTMDGLTTV